jgi:hypothetical protein
MFDVHRPHTSYTGTTVFSGTPLARDRTKEVSEKGFTVSLAAAQERAGSAQLGSPVKEDLATLKHCGKSPSLLRTGHQDR